MSLRFTAAAPRPITPEWAAFALGMKVGDIVTFGKMHRNRSVVIRNTGLVIEFMLLEGIRPQNRH